MEREFWPEFSALDTYMDRFFRTAPWPFGTRTRALPTGRPFFPATDVLARNGDVLVSVDLPGIDPAKDVTVRVEEGELVVKGERRQKSEFKDKDYFRAETTQGMFERHIPLPKGVDDAKIAAEYKDGILEILIPGAHKLAEIKAKTVPIKIPAKV